MIRTLSRATFVAALISAATTAAIAAPTGSAPSYGCPTGAATASTTCVNGGGSSLAKNVYVGTNTVTPSLAGEMTQYALSTAGSSGFAYEKAGSGAGQSAFLNNDPSLFGNGSLAGAYNVHFGASDAFIDGSSVLNPYVGANKPLPSGGQFIQIPMFATPITIPLRNAKVASNWTGGVINSTPKVTLTDDDLCGIFSGLITNWNQTSAAASLTAGTIKVYWRADNLGSGTTFLLTQHLASVCTAANTASSATFTGFVKTTKLAKLFVGWTGPATGDKTTLYTIPSSSAPNFVAGISGSGALANGVNNDATGSAIGYVSPDFTSIAVTPAASGVAKPFTNLYVAGVKNATDGVSYLPTLAAVTTAITTGAGSAINPTPPTSFATAAIQTNWVPQIAAPTAGYPIVGYTNLLIAQCYKNVNVANSLSGYLKNHYNGLYNGMLKSNGFVPLVTSTSNGFGTAIITQFLGPNGFMNGTVGLNVNNGAACPSTIVKR